MDELDDHESKNFVRLYLILMPRACEVLRKLFRETWRSSTGAEWLDSAAQGEQFIENIGKEFYEAEPDKLKEKLASGLVDEWDFTLVCHILLKLDFADFAALNRSQRSKIRRILDIRNDLSHHGTQRITNEEFRNKWKQIEDILLFFGYSRTDLNALRSRCGCDTSDDSDISDDSNVSTAERYNEKGNLKVKMGRFREAIEYYTEALNIFDLPKMNSAKYYSNRSFAYLKLASDDRDMLMLALKDAEMAEKLRPEWERSLFRLGCVYQEMEEYEKALKYFSSLSQDDPGNEIVKKARKYCLKKIHG